MFDLGGVSLAGVWNCCCCCCCYTATGAPVMDAPRKDGVNHRGRSVYTLLSTHVITLTCSDAPVNLCRHVECSFSSTNLGRYLRSTLEPRSAAKRISSRVRAHVRETRIFLNFFATGASYGSSAWSVKKVISIYILIKIFFNKDCHTRKFILSFEKQTRHKIDTSRMRYIIYAWYILKHFCTIDSVDYLLSLYNLFLISFLQI